MNDDRTVIYKGTTYTKVPAIDDTCFGCARLHIHEGYAERACHQSLDCNMASIQPRKPYILVHPTEQAMVKYLTERLS